MPSKVSTSHLTSYDLLKSLALVLMVIDHIGYYFYPDHEILRAVGRASMPIWFFLIGFAHGRDLSKPLWIGAGLILISNIVFGGEILPLNILLTIIITRLVLDAVCRMTFRNWEFALYGGFGMAVLTLPTMFIFEYGTSAVLLAMAGYIARNATSVNLSHKGQIGFMIFSVVFYAFYQLILFQFSKETGQAMVVSIGAVSLLLWYFRPQELPKIEEKLPKLATKIFQIGGRYTMEFYVAHVILFKLICCIYGLKAYGWFHPHFIA